LNLPPVELAIAINEAVRESDEWFEEPDDLERLTIALRSVEGISDPVAAAARLAFRVTAAQAFAEGNKRTAFLLARWVLDHNGVDGAKILPTEDEDLADLLVKAASGLEVETAVLELLHSRS
jgi:prophage maintenance system killer protein